MIFSNCSYLYFVFIRLPTNLSFIMWIIDSLYDGSNTWIWVSKSSKCWIIPLKSFVSLSAVSRTRCVGSLTNSNCYWLVVDTWGLKVSSCSILSLNTYGVAWGISTWLSSIGLIFSFWPSLAANSCILDS